MLRARRGYTVVETLIAVSIGTLIIGLGASIGFRHQRFHRDIVIAVERTEQLEQIVALMPISIRAIAPAEGDIAPGAARDTSLEFRATIATSVVCDSGQGKVILAPVAASPRLTSIVSRPEAGDTAWALAVSASGEQWMPHAIGAVADAAHACALGGTLPFGDSPLPAITLSIATPLPGPGTALRVTRPWRYSLYRASDGAWYLGAKDWNPALARFNTIQPVAGPFMSAAKSGVRFNYLDSLGATLPSGLTESAGIALVEVAFRADSVIPGTYDHFVSIRGRLASAIALRNRRR